MIYRVAATAICLAAGAAAAQQGSAQNGAAGTNPFARSDKYSFFGNLQGPLNSQGFARPQPHVSPVTPVPEPSEWALMAAGLALVGFIVRRSSKRRD
jgi:hypothetical protein